MSCDHGRPQRDLLLRTALALAKRGWRVFPCAVGGKQPAMRGNWRALATTDPLRIRKWWTARRWNIGISCGPDLVVLDLDVPGHGTPGPGSQAGTATGADELARLCREQGEPYPGDTFAVATPSGGTHLYFTAPADGDGLRNSAGKLGPLIDIRADGGYVVGPGSHLDQGGYQVTRSERLLPFPDWLTRRLTETRSSPEATDIANGDLVAAHGDGADGDPMAALHYAENRVATAPEGTRNDTLNRAAYYTGQLTSAGLLPAGLVASSLLDAAIRFRAPRTGSTPHDPKRDDGGPTAAADAPPPGRHLVVTTARDAGPASKPTGKPTGPAVETVSRRAGPSKPATFHTVGARDRPSDCHELDGMTITE